MVAGRPLWTPIPLLLLTLKLERETGYEHYVYNYTGAYTARVFTRYPLPIPAPIPPIYIYICGLALFL